ncbi:MAG: septum formation initiator family protein [Acidimicrobiales bacterium]|nr:septum formation initiator family protein [Acidimicrobiales bacterium]
MSPPAVAPTGRAGRVAPEHAPRRRPPLRVVERPERSPRARRRRAAAVGVLAALLVFGALFGMTVFQTILVQGQARLDRLDQRIAAEQQRLEGLRVDVAALEAPERIVAEAERRLGMVPPDEVVYVSPPAELAAELGVDPAGRALSSGTGEQVDEWSQVKPYLGSRP